MSLFMLHRLLRAPTKIIPVEYCVQVNNYAIPGMSLGKGKKLGKGKGTTVEKKLLPVETDVNKLVTYCCGTNLRKEGGEDVKLKPDEEYPDWLWTIRTGPAPKLEELDPNTKEYWKRLRREGIKRDNKLKSLRKF
ncbi:39S ribosomal protein L54, mitochondrial [Nasonia vitripennis]|uniref:Large ribosomal subunit protein mL54 n=1 Tax=Nasonia vitripennis TaxID=7425 RepID=A0A7M7R179_NASVI|nr:39S ribosomal protein L54, mitochondrial [Nasonia vitripennis]XP_032455799.1 39S ribosomal protein L54, mitochondrial [Nasonia vitripennis]